MTIKDDLHHLVDELDDAAAREAIMRIQDLIQPRVARDETNTEARRAAVLATEEAEIDAEYDRAYREHPINESERRVLDAFSKAGIRSLQRPLG
jgi:hypothetical protein